MSLSRNLWSVLLVAATSAVGTLVLVLNRDDAETAFAKRVNYDPLGALTQIADESKVLKASQFPDLKRQRVIMAAVNIAFRQDKKLTKKIVREQMQGATQTITIRQLIQSQIAAGDVIPAMETQLLVSGEKSIGTNGALWVASAAGSAELPEALLWLAKLKTRDEKLTAYDSLWRNLQKVKDDRGLHQLFLANPGEPEGSRRNYLISSIASIRHMKGDSVGLSSLRESLPESEREWVDFGMLSADALQPRYSLMARASKLIRARHDAISAVIYGELEKDALNAASYVLSLPDELFPEALNALGNGWRNKDIAAYAEWVRSLPPGPRREQAIASFVTINRGQNKPRAIARKIAEMAADPDAREKLAESVR